MFEEDRLPEEFPAESKTPEAETSSQEPTYPPDPPGIAGPDPPDAVAPAPDEAMEPDHDEAAAPAPDDTMEPDQLSVMETGSFFSPEVLGALLQAGKPSLEAAKLSGEDPTLERLSRLETRLEELIATGSARGRRMEETNRTMRAYFTDDIGRLREAVTNELRTRAALRLLQDTVPILNDLDDLLERSEEAAHDETTARLWRALEAFRRRFYNGLRRLGLEEIHVVENETLFDPYIHECIDSREAVSGTQAEEIPPDTIVKVKRRGYLFQNELFEAPQVIIQGGETNGIS